MAEDNPEEAQIIPDYESLAVEDEEREVDLDILPAKTLTEAEEETEQKTDLQAAMKALLPRYKNKRLNEVLQPAMVSRIFPDNFIDKNRILVTALVEECEGDEDIDIIGIISSVQDALSIGFEGRGRVDILEIAGVAHEEDMERLSKELGL